MVKPRAESGNAYSAEYDNSMSVMMLTVGYGSRLGSLQVIFK